MLILYFFIDTMTKENYTKEEIMEETKKSKTSANGLILAILLVVAIIIALMWLMVYKLNEDKDELQSQVNSAKSETEVLKRQVILLQTKLDQEYDNKVDNTADEDEEDENKVSNEVDEDDDEDEEDEIDNTVDNDTEDNPV